MRLNFTFGLLALLILTGCTQTVQPTPEPAPPTETPVPTPTLFPTPATPLAILVLPADMDQETSALYQKTVYDLCQAEGYRFQVRNSLSITDLEPMLKVVIALPPDPGIAALAAAAPQTQFLAVNIPGITAGGNISTLASANARPDIPAFMAGYIAAMITEDYHIGMIIPKDNPEALQTVTAYKTGMEYYCGLCNPWAGPFYDYPIWVEIPAEAKPSEYSAYVDYLAVRYEVETIYLHPDIATPEILSYISTSGLLQLGAFTPDQDYNGWVVSIQPDEIRAIQAAWPELIAGKGGQTIPAPLVLKNADPDLLGLGKQKLAQEVLDDVLAGYISTGVEP
jgi:hypothetical protein